MRGGKRYFVANKSRKHPTTEISRSKKSVKLRSEAWYQKAAATFSISNRSVNSPSIVPE